MINCITADWPAPSNIVAGTLLREGDIAELGLPGQPCWLRQVHGHDVVVAGCYETPPAADSSVSSDPHHICVVQTADCLPVLFCSEDGARVAAAHAGWRGLASAVIENTITSMEVGAEHLLVWLGPAISAAAFEVGDEVREAFFVCDAAASDCFVRNERGRWQADLYALARQRLAAAGVTQVFGGGFCTYRDEQRFPSYRRDKSADRIVSFAAIKAP